MAGVETSVTSVDKTECPECYLAIRSNQTETHFRTPPLPPPILLDKFIPRTKIYGVSTVCHATILPCIIFLFLVRE